MSNINHERLDIPGIAEYVDRELRAGRTMQNIAMQLGMPAQTLYSRVYRLGYRVEAAKRLIRVQEK